MFPLLFSGQYKISGDQKQLDRIALRIRKQAKKDDVSVKTYTEDRHTDNPKLVVFTEDDTPQLKERFQELQRHWLSLGRYEQKRLAREEELDAIKTKLADAEVNFDSVAKSELARFENKHKPSEPKAWTQFLNDTIRPLTTLDGNTVEAVLKKENKTVQFDYKEGTLSDSKESIAPAVPLKTETKEPTKTVFLKDLPPKKAKKTVRVVDREDKKKSKAPWILGLLALVGLTATLNSCEEEPVNDPPETSIPFDPTPADPTEPTDPTPTEPTDPTPTEPTDPTPTEPTDPTPTEPTDPTPTEPTDPTPTEPTDPTPTEPSDPTPAEPTDPTPTEPADPTPTEPVNPTPVVPTPVQPETPTTTTTTNPTGPVAETPTEPADRVDTPPVVTETPDVTNQMAQAQLDKILKVLKPFNGNAEIQDDNTEIKVFLSNGHQYGSFKWNQNDNNWQYAPVSLSTPYDIESYLRGYNQNRDYDANFNTIRQNRQQENRIRGGVGDIDSDIAMTLGVHQLHQNEGQAVIYTVKRADTVFDIAQAVARQNNNLPYNTAEESLDAGEVLHIVDSIIEQNNLSRDALIYPGQQLNLSTVLK